TLLGLAQLWRISNISELREIAPTLGADVPFFLHGGRALGTGIGTKISSLPDMTTQHLLIVAPAVSVSTADAYKAVKAPALTSQNAASILSVSRAGSSLSDSDQGLLRDDLRNDFERVIFDIEPEIGRAKNALLQVGAGGASLSGSGSSVFGIFDSAEARQRAAEQIQTENGWRVFPCVTLSGEEYSRAMGSWGSQL
ncbi:MAG: 4-(cytidine 5'-diphospho)-2-C-methyl-D-erythritol kinase, partial [Pyrinomonadaceae bacterium]